MSSGSELSRSRSTHALKSRENSPDRGGSDGDKEALSSWARYLKNKYGNRSTKDSPRDGLGASSSTPSSSYSSTAASSSPSSTSASTSASRRLSLGLPLRQANELHSSDDDSKNLQSSLASPTQAQAQAAGMEDTNTKFSTPRTQYLQKRRQILQIGGRGSETGKFTWPRGISVGPDNLIVVADSSNHRVQVFDANGTYQKEFGTYGNGDGEFDCLAGVAINRIGQFIIADRYNHRIQVFDPAGEISVKNNLSISILTLHNFHRTILENIWKSRDRRRKVQLPLGHHNRLNGLHLCLRQRKSSNSSELEGFIETIDDFDFRLVPRFFNPTAHSWVNSARAAVARVNLWVFSFCLTLNSFKFPKLRNNHNAFNSQEHPHYIAVSNTNRVIVSDSNNHRIQVAKWTPRRMRWVVN